MTVMLAVLMTLDPWSILCWPSCLHDKFTTLLKIHTIVEWTKLRSAKGVFISTCKNACDHRDHSCQVTRIHHLGICLMPCVCIKDWLSLCSKDTDEQLLSKVKLTEVANTVFKHAEKSQTICKWFDDLGAGITESSSTIVCLMICQIIDCVPQEGFAATNAGHSTSLCFRPCGLNCRDHSTVSRQPGGLSADAKAESDIRHQTHIKFMTPHWCFVQRLTTLQEWGSKPQL